MDLTFIRQ